MNGPKAIAFGTDAVAPIKVLNDFAKEHKALELKVGYVDGEIVINPTTDAYVMNNGVLVPSTYANGVLTFTMPDPS